MALDVDAARAAVQKVADAMGLDSVEQAAEGILAIVNENMAGALRLVSVQRGHDPRDFALVAYGGAGPAARERAREADGLVPGDRPAGAGPPLRDRRPRRRLPRRVRADVHPARSADASGDEVAEHPRRARRPRARSGSRARGSTSGARRISYSRGHALPPAGLRDPGRARPGRGARRRARRPRGAVQRAARAALRVPDARHRVARSSTCARSGTAPCRSPSSRSARRAAPTPRGRSSTSTRSSSTGSACRRRSTTARSSSRGPRSTARRS